MLEDLKQTVYEANIKLVKHRAVIFTWGNVSGIDYERGLMVIKPSGIDYEQLNPSDMVVVDIHNGRVVEGKYKPSSDMKTHMELYRAFPEIGGVAHTHSINAVAFAQAGLAIPALGTTHADCFYGSSPCTRKLTIKEVNDDYELNTGRVIVECINENRINPVAIPGILVNNHGPFSWGNSASDSVYNAITMEIVAEMCLKTLMLNPNSCMEQYVLDKHYFRKHGPNAYYGQEIE